MIRYFAVATFGGLLAVSDIPQEFKEVGALGTCVAIVVLFLKHMRSKESNDRREREQRDETWQSTLRETTTDFKETVERLATENASDRAARQDMAHKLVSQVQTSRHAQWLLEQADKRDESRRNDMGS